MASFVPEKRPSPPEAAVNVGANLEQQEDTDHKEKFDDLLQEIRVLLSGSQVLTAFLVSLPFNMLLKCNPDQEKVYPPPIKRSPPTLINLKASKNK